MKALGVENEATCTPQVMQKVVVAASSSLSYAQASKHLRELAEIDIGAKRCQRIAQRIGEERNKQVEERLEAYEALPLPDQKMVPPDAPQGGWENRVAAVMIDGGRAQVRDERWGTEPTPGEARRSFWCETKTALLVTFSSTEQEADPQPEVPECLQDPLWLIPRINEMKAVSGGESAAKEVSRKEDEQADPLTGADNNDELSAAETSGKSKAAKRSTRSPKKNHWSPTPLVRTVVATFAAYLHLGALARVEAFHRGFTAAARKVFLGDGLPANWSIHKKYFGDYTPVVDMMHALSYVYAAAKAYTGDMEECWVLCKQWVEWVWQGKVGLVIEAIDGLLEHVTDPAVREQLSTSRRYLYNNINRMHYADYRRLGLPITTALMESTIKQINRRIKGTEKFWRDGATPQLQLCADSISETDPMQKFWKHREANQTGWAKNCRAK